MFALRHPVSVNMWLWNLILFYNKSWIKRAVLTSSSILSNKTIFSPIQLKTHKIEDLGFRKGEHNGLILKNSAFSMTSIAFYKAVVKNKAAHSVFLSNVQVKVCTNIKWVVEFMTWGYKVFSILK